MHLILSVFERYPFSRVNGKAYKIDRGSIVRIYLVKNPLDISRVL